MKQAFVQYIQEQVSLSFFKKFQRCLIIDCCVGGREFELGNFLFDLKPSRETYLNNFNLCLPHLRIFVSMVAKFRNFGWKWSYPTYLNFVFDEYDHELQKLTSVESVELKPICTIDCDTFILKRTCII